MGTLALLARGAHYIDYTITAGGGETAWEIEINRSPDFNSDESIFRAYAGAGNQPGSYDLLADTVYYHRVRKTNGGNGPWSQTYMWKTLVGPAANVPAYNGYSIEPAMLVVPEPMWDMAATNVEAGSDVKNLCNDDPMSTLRLTNNSAITFRTPGRKIDVFAILGTLANHNVTWRIRGFATAADLAALANVQVDTGVVGFHVSPGIGPRRHVHAYRRLAQTYTHEYWRIDIAGVATSFFLARHLVVGWGRASVNLSRGAGHAPLDMGRVERTIFGQPDRVVGWRGRAVEFPLSWIGEAEYETKWRELDTVVGTTDPVLALPNPKVSHYLNDRIAYGEIASMRGEIVRGEKYARNIEINSLY